MEKEIKNEIVNIESVNENNDLKVRAKNSIFSEHFYFSEIFDESIYKKFIKNIEKCIRTSLEYKEYIEKLRTNYTALNSDNILSNITTMDVDLEFHHYPFSLYDIVDSVVSKRLIDEKKITSFSIAKEVLNLHFKNKIGLVPLTKTNHQLAHNGYLFISEKQVFGEYKKFYKEYEAGISSSLKEQIKNLEKMSKMDLPSDYTGIF